MIGCDLPKGQSHDTSPQLNLTTRYISLGACAFPRFLLYAQGKVSKLATELDGKLEAMKELAVEKADVEAMKKEVIDLRKKVDMKDEASLDLKVKKRGRVVDGGPSACFLRCMKGLLAANTQYLVDRVMQLRIRLPYTRTPAVQFPAAKKVAPCVVLMCFHTNSPEIPKQRRFSCRFQSKRGEGAHLVACSTYPWMRPKMYLGSAWFRWMNQCAYLLAPGDQTIKLDFQSAVRRLTPISNMYLSSNILVSCRT